MTQIFDERTARKRYVQRRQKNVIVMVSALLVVALIIASLFFFHVGGLGRASSERVLPNYGQTAPCSVNKEDGTHAVYEKNNNVQVRVLNGTSFSGFAGAVSEALQLRDFSMQEAGNYTSTNVKRTKILFGVNSINQAYTLASNFTDAVMVMDDRQDAVIDVVLGATFKDLKDLEDVPEAGTKITDIEGCVAADSMTDLPSSGTQSDDSATDSNAEAGTEG